MKFPPKDSDEGKVDILLEKMGRHINRMNYGNDSLFESVHDQLLNPPEYEKEIMRAHTINFMKLFPEDVQVNDK